MSFRDLGLDEKTIHAIEDLGYQEPTTVQKDVIPSILEGKDIFTIAPAVCGKTCAYIFPLIDIISKNEGQNILIITADSKESVNISDKFAIFNKYHEINDENNDSASTLEANVIIASPSLLLENIAENNLDISNINILVVDDINLIKKNRQLENLEKILEQLPANKQNIVFTTRRSKETQDILNKILKTPAEIKIDKNKESELTEDIKNEPQMPGSSAPERPRVSKYARKRAEVKQDKKALDLARKYKIFGKSTPAFLLDDTTLVSESNF
jgi:superfamily II DNA/RNA helicase